MNLLKNNGWKCLWRGHPAQPTDQLKPPAPGKGVCEREGASFGSLSKEPLLKGREVEKPPPPPPTFTFSPTLRLAVGRRHRWQRCGCQARWLCGRSLWPPAPHGGCWCACFVGPTAVAPHPPLPCFRSLAVVCVCLRCVVGLLSWMHLKVRGLRGTAPEAVRQAVGGGCQSGWGRSLSVGYKCH